MRNTINVCVIDYGMGNLQSVAKAFEKSGARVGVTGSMKKISPADCVVLPGVGSFDVAVRNLKKRGIWEGLPRIIEKKPFFGICLGLQLLFEKSEEGKSNGLGIFKGFSRKFDETKMLVPHMGWNQIKFKVQSSKFKVSEGIQDDSYFYFVHSYYVEPEDKSIIASTTDYGAKFCSAVYKENIFACQFHPEKSGSLGLKLIRNFIEKIC